MCKYCEEDAFNVLIKSEEISNMIYWIVGKSNEVKREDIHEVDNSVVFEIRCGAGYLRLGDSEDMDCLDSEYKIRVPNCPMCGRKLNESWNSLEIN